jgi:hypothetical protein
VATISSPLAVYAATDQARASAVIQGLGNIPSVAVVSGSLGQTVNALGALQTQIDSSNPIVLLVSSASASTPLFQDIAVYCQGQSKRLIVIDLDDVGAANVTGNIKNFSDTVISSCDAELEGVLEAPDRWTLPSGEPYPETGIKHQSKC